MPQVLTSFGDERLAVSLAIARAGRPDIRRFRCARSVLEEYLGRRSHNPHGSFEALIVNSSPRNRLAVVLGLRLLRDGPAVLPYDDLELAAGPARWTA